MNVLVIAPHPDDEVLGCGGTIARHVAEGDTVHILLVTRGASELFPKAVVEQTRTEMRRAHEILGTHQIHTLDYPAPLMDTMPQHKVADDFRKVIYETRAEVVYLPHRGDMHFEHTLIYMAGLVACRPVANSPVRRVYAYETLSETDWAPPFANDAFIPIHFVDISGEYLDKKLTAMACFKTQLKPPPSARSIEGLRALAALRGGTISRNAAEAFMPVREIR